MAVTIQGKLNELSSCQKTDGSIQSEYNKISIEHQQTKAVYKSSKAEYQLANEQLEKAKEYFMKAPLSKAFSADKQVRLAKKKFKTKKEKISSR